MKNLKSSFCFLIMLFSLPTLQAQSQANHDLEATVVKLPSPKVGNTNILSLNSGQEVWQADLAVEMEQTNSGYQIYTINVTCSNDDDCRSPKLIFTLPRQSRIRGVVFDSRLDQTAYSIMGSASQVVPDTLTFDGYVQVDFPNLPKGRTTLTISVELDEEVLNSLKKGMSNKNYGASVMVYSITPELRKENNFSYLTLKS